MQQIVNRLTDGSRAIGTSGQINDSTVVVDRATLEQLRREIDAALAAIGKR